MNDTQKAYLAGVIDGEGSIFPSITGTGTMHIVLTISNTCEAMIDFIVSLVPGIVKVSYSVHNGNRRRMFRCSTTKSGLIAQVLEDVLPYLIAKKELAELALRFCKNHVRYSKGNSIEEILICHEMRKIYGKGLCGEEI